MYRNATDFCTLILYLATLLNSLVSCSSFYVAYVGFSMHSIISKRVLLLPFQFWFSVFFFFSYLIAVGRNSKNMLNKTAISRQSWIFLKKILSVFWGWVLLYLWAYHICFFLCWGRFTLCPHSKEFLFINVYYILSKYFMHLLRW